MKYIAQLIALNLPDSSPAQVSAAMCMTSTYLKTGFAWLHIKSESSSKK